MGIVGTKETVRIMNEKSVLWGLSDLKLGKFSKDFLMLVDGADMKSGSVVPLPGVNLNLKKIMKSAFVNATGSAFYSSDRTLTTGLVGVIFMLHVCRQVNLYEMVPSSLTDKSAPWHYYERGGIAQSNP